MTEERWRAVRGASHYLVSDRGRIMSLVGPPKILRCASRGVGDYPRVNLVGDDGTCRNTPVHRLVLEAFRPVPPPRMKFLECRHLDGNSANNILENLTWGTIRQNIDDRTEHGRSRGGFVLLGFADEIRRKSSEGAGAADLAKQYGVCIQSIRLLLRGRTYGGEGKRCWAGKLTAEQRRDIRERFPSTGAGPLAKEYGVSTQTIYNTIRNIYYADRAEGKA